MRKESCCPLSPYQYLFEVNFQLSPPLRGVERECPGLESRSDLYRSFRLLLKNNETWGFWKLIRNVHIMGSNIFFFPLKILELYYIWWIYSTFHLRSSHFLYLDRSSSSKTQIYYYQSLGINIREFFFNSFLDRRKLSLHSKTILYNVYNQ